MLLLTPDKAVFSLYLAYWSLYFRFKATRGRNKAIFLFMLTLEDELSSLLFCVPCEWLSPSPVWRYYN